MDRITLEWEEDELVFDLEHRVVRNSKKQRLKIKQGNLKMNSWNVDPNAEVYLNTTRLEEVMRSRRALKFLEKDINQVVVEVDLICSSDFDLANWIANTLSSFQMFSNTSVIGIWKKSPDAGEFSTVLVNINRSSLNITMTLTGPIKDVADCNDWVKTQGFKPKEVMIDWVFGPNYKEMEGYSLPLKVYPEIQGSYPWMKDSIESYTKKFLDAKECVLVLKGSPGTGKTSFIKRMIESSKTSAMVTYDSSLLFSDGFFASFMTRDDCNILVIEDADNMLGSRTEGNPLMDRLLNASDGLISLSSKKIIFSTNLGNVSSIDQALLRKGRCFDIIDFRRLTRDEAKVVTKNYYGKDVELVGSNFSLAEITNIDFEATKMAAAILKAGFIGT